MELCEDVFTHLHDVFWLDKRTIFKAADYQQENISAQGFHLDPINIHSADFEEAADVLEDIDEDQSKLLQRLFHTSFVIN